MTAAPNAAPGEFDLGGGGNSSFSFGPQGTQPGAWVSGSVVEMAEVQARNFDNNAPEFWDDGSPKMQTKLTLQTELRDPNNATDKGLRDVYLDGRRRPNDNGTKSRICAVLDAVREATGGTVLRRGGVVTLQWISGMGFAGDPRNYQATYQPPALDLAAPVAAPVPQAAAPIAQPPVQAAPVAAAPVMPPVAQAAPPAWSGAEAPAPVQAVPVAPPIAAPVAAAPVAQPAGVPDAAQLAALHNAGITDPAAIRQIYPSYAG